MVTDANDSPEEARKIADWVVGTLSPDVPLHYVRFHPDYKYTHVGRTPVERLEQARLQAMEAGIKFCYLGNVYDNPATNSYCPSCGTMVVQRYGLAAVPIGLDANACCTNCGMTLPFVMPGAAPAPTLRADEVPDSELVRSRHHWRGDVKAVHVEVHNNDSAPRMVRVRTLGSDHDGNVVREIPIMPGKDFRFISCKSQPDDLGVTLEHPRSVRVECYEVYDRAHFPTQSLNEPPASDAVPQPVFIDTPGRVRPE